uniref:Trafficking protein particle complex subunit n=1 Tax=Fibrocapsa japonica TaxID=94617 RepID=A0A7S2V4X7_9STRA
MGKVNAELFSLTYGSMVMQLIEDYEDVNAVNIQLEKMGYNMGVRLIDEFLAKSGLTVSCQDFRETGEVIAKVAFKMFLGLGAEASQWNNEGTAFSLVFPDNPLTEFVELPPQFASSLLYSNLLCGVIRGALEMVQIRIECRFVRDVLQGDEVNEIRIELKEFLEDIAGEDYKES